MTDELKQEVILDCSEINRLWWRNKEFWEGLKMLEDQIVRRMLNLITELKMIQQYRERLVSDERRVIAELEAEIGRYQNNSSR